jgi:hypothetical protein
MPDERAQERIKAKGEGTRDADPLVLAPSSAALGLSDTAGEHPAPDTESTQGTSVYNWETL